MTEWSKVHDWKSCVPARVPRVRIPLSPLRLRCAQAARREWAFERLESLSLRYAFAALRLRGESGRSSGSSWRGQDEATNPLPVGEGGERGAARTGGAGGDDESR